MIHHLKILPVYFNAQISGAKNFELRKNDRDFKLSDKIMLHEVTRLKPHEKTGRSCLVEITFVLSHIPNCPFEGLKDGYCVIGTRLLKVC